MRSDELLGFLQEDVGHGDITTDSTIPRSMEAVGEVVAKEDGVIAGLEEAGVLLSHLGLKTSSRYKDGNKVPKGAVVLRVVGKARVILSSERVVLNLLMRMSGVATHTRRFVENASGVTIAGTRKTTPGFRYLEKKAIAIGGGSPHRYALDDGILIKDNHLALAGLEEAIKKAKRDFTKKVEVEVSSTRDAVRAAELGADIIMLDNMPPKRAGDAIKALERRGFRKRVTVEVSGGVTLDNLARYAALKPDVISVGPLTTGSRWLDMSMRVRKK